MLHYGAMISRLSGDGRFSPTQLCPGIPAFHTLLFEDHATHFRWTSASCVNEKVRLLNHRDSWVSDSLSRWRNAMPEENRKLGWCSQMSRHVKSGNACKRTLEYAGVEKQIAKKSWISSSSFSLFFFRTTSVKVKPGYFDNNLQCVKCQNERHCLKYMNIWCSFKVQSWCCTLELCFVLPCVLIWQ